MVAGYLADRYAVAASAEQTRVEANLAREEAAKARLAAEQAKEEAEIKKPRGGRGGRGPSRQRRSARRKS